MVGGGSLPGETLPTYLFSITPASPDKMLKKLRDLPVPVIARIENDSILFDPRTVMPAQEETFLSGVAALTGN